MSPLLFLVKFMHTIAIIVLLLCLMVVWYYALEGLLRRWLVPALTLIALEAVVFIAYGWRCPLTDWALALGDETGHDFIGEYLLPNATNYVPSFTIFTIAGVVLTLRRWWLFERLTGKQYDPRASSTR